MININLKTKKMKTMKNLIFVSVLGTLMMFASCSKSEKNDVVITSIRPVADTIYYGYWIQTASTGINKNIWKFKITQDSLSFTTNGNSEGKFITFKNLIWSIDTIQHSNYLEFYGNSIPSVSYVILEKPTKNIMKLISNDTLTFQRQ